MSTNKNRNKWRYRCPEGHTQWRESGDGYYCNQCADMGDDPHFDFLSEAEADPFHY